jgi:integrase
MKYKLPPRKPTEKKRRPKKLTLTEYAEHYLASRDVSPDYKHKTRYCIRSFVEWFGSDLKIAELDCDAANEWIDAMLTTDLARETINGYRRGLRCVWMFAYENGDNDNPPLRLKKIRVPRDSVEAFTHDQIAKLLEAAASMKGFFNTNGVRRSLFWTAAIHAAYSTGLRRGDLTRIKRSDIGPDGRAKVLQHKTGYAVFVQFSPEAMTAIAAIQADDDERAIPWPFHTSAMARQFRDVMKAAGIAKGQFKWLRRSCGSYAEAANPGTGPRALGHRTLSVFNNNYNDQSISVSQPVTPPPLIAKGGTA